MPVEYSETKRRKRSNDAERDEMQQAVHVKLEQIEWMKYSIDYLNAKLGAEVIADDTISDNMDIDDDEVQEVVSQMDNDGNVDSTTFVDGEIVPKSVVDGSDQGDENNSGNQHHLNNMMDSDQGLVNIVDINADHSNIAVGEITPQSIVETFDHGMENIIGDQNEFNNIVNDVNKKVSNNANENANSDQSNIVVGENMPQNIVDTSDHGIQNIVGDQSAFNNIMEDVIEEMPYNMDENTNPDPSNIVNDEIANQASVNTPNRKVMVDAEFSVNYRYKLDKVSYPHHHYSLFQMPFIYNVLS